MNEDWNAAAQTCALRSELQVSDLGLRISDFLSVCRDHNFWSAGQLVSWSASPPASSCRFGSCMWYNALFVKDNDSTLALPAFSRLLMRTVVSAL